MRIPPRSEPSWIEPVRWTSALLWVVVLTLWLYYQVLFLYSPNSALTDSIHSASVTLRTFRYVWFASLLPALAFGLAWYAFCHPRPRPDGIRLSGIRRLAGMQRYGALCTGICAYLLAYRLLPVLPFTTSGLERAAPELLRFQYGAASWAVDTLPEQFVWIGGLAAAVSGVQAWGLLPRLGGSRVRLAALAAVLLAVGCGVVWLGLLESIPSSAPSAVFALKLATPAERGLVLGGEEDRDAAVRLMQTYLWTHDANGQEVSLRNIDDEGPPNCGLCRLPRTAAWTTHGLSLRLSRDRTLDDGPSGVIEIPRQSDVARWYRPGNAKERSKVPIGEIAARLGGADWLVLKIDFAVPLPIVRDLVEGLRDAGVRRVDLAVVPQGFAPLSEEIPQLEFGEHDTAVQYVPQPSREYVSQPVVVKRYIPASPDPRPTCSWVDWWSVHDEAIRFELAPGGSLPDHVGLSVDASANYGEFVGTLQTVLTAGVETITVALR